MAGPFENAFRDIHALTAKWELDRRPSMLSTLFIVSALQFLNLLSVGMMVESAFSRPMPASRMGFVALLGVLVAINFAWSKKLGLRVGEPTSRSVRFGSPGVVYLVATIVVFVIAAIWMSAVYAK